MRNELTWSVRLSILVLAAGLIGCGEQAGIKGLIPVKGQVTLDGQPLAGAQVVFVPSSPGGRASSATTDANGNYALITNTDQGAMPGSYRVMVSHVVGRDGKPITEFEEGMDITQLQASGQAKQALPPRYSDEQQTELKFDVSESGENVYNIDLKTG